MKFIKNLLINLLVVHLFFYLLLKLPIVFPLNIDFRYYYILELLLIVFLFSLIISKWLKEEKNKKLLSKKTLIIIWKRLNQQYQKIKKQLTEENILNYLQNSKLIRFLNKPLIKFFLMPLVLLFFALGFSAWIAINSDSAITVLSKHGDQSYFNNYNTKPLVLGDVITGNFTAQENNLGILSIKFDNHQSASGIILTFKIKEEGTEQWLSESNYLSSQFHHSGFMYFGFPIQEDSKDKDYAFEIVVNDPSLMQDEELAEEGQLDEVDEESEEEYFEEFINDFENETIIEPLKLSEDQTIIRTHYKFNKQLLTGDWQSASSFIISKISEVISNKAFIFNSIIGFIPLLFYLSVLKFNKWFRKEFNGLNNLVSLGLISYLSMEIFYQSLKLFELDLNQEISYSFIFTLTIILISLIYFYRNNSEKN